MPEAFPHDSHPGSNKRQRREVQDQNKILHSGRERQLAQEPSHGERPAHNLNHQAGPHKSLMSMVPKWMTRNADRRDPRPQDKRKTFNNNDTIPSLAKDRHTRELTEQLDKTKDEVRDLNKAIQRKNQSISCLEDNLQVAKEQHDSFDAAARHHIHQQDIQLGEAKAALRRDPEKQANDTDSVQVELREMREEL